MPNRRRRSRKGTLLLIGGREDKHQSREILTEVARRVGRGRLCVATVASRIGHELWDEYRQIFRSLGVKHLSHLDVVNRQESVDHRALKAVEDIDGIFFTGGDQLKITSELGGTSIVDRIVGMYESGGLIAGTSAGAAVMSETMLFSRSEEEMTPRSGGSIQTAPGLGFIRNVIVDQHFAQRGRVARLISAIAQNPKFIGIGINEDTAVLAEDERRLKVLGSGAVYVLDAHESTDLNVSELGGTLSLFNGRFHILSSGDEYDLKEKRPYTAARR